MTGPPCTAVGCHRTDTRRYLTGHCCPHHTPAASAGRPEPAEHDTSWIAKTQQTLDWAKGGTDLNKERTGGYVSRQRAQRIAETRDALRKSQP